MTRLLSLAFALFVAANLSAYPRALSIVRSPEPMHPCCPRTSVNSVLTSMTCCFSELFIPERSFAAMSPASCCCSEIANIFQEGHHASETGAEGRAGIGGIAL